jgi:hypothetical protein
MDAPEMDADPQDDADASESDVPESDAPESDAPESDAPESDVDDDSDVQQGQGPLIEIDPGSLDFGEVGVLNSAFATVAVVNAGDEALLLEELRLAVAPSESFQVVLDQILPVAIGPGERWEFRLRFRPAAVRGGRATPYGNTVEILSNDPSRPLLQLPLEGVAMPDPIQCLSFDALEVDFGFVAPDEVTVRTLELTNCGLEALEVSSLELSGATSDLSISFGPELPATVAPGDGFNVLLTYTPTQVGTIMGAVVARSSGRARAETILLAGPICPVAVATGQIADNDPVGETVAAVVGQPITVGAFDSVDPSLGALSYAWTVDAPAESAFVLTPQQRVAESFEVVPDEPGLYRFSLEVRSDVSGLVSCDTGELSLDVGPATPRAQIVLTWDNGADLDLHLVRSQGEGFAAFGTNNNRVEDDCYFANLSPDWGLEGAGFDDPRLLGDDTDGEGPETILVPVLEDGRRYRVGINYARRQETERVEATVSITIGEDEASVFLRTLESRGVFWVPVIIEQDGTLTETDELVEP